MYFYTIHIPHTSVLIKSGAFGGAIPNCVEMTIKSKPFASFTDVFSNSKSLMSGLANNIKHVAEGAEFALTLLYNPQIYGEDALDDWPNNVLAKLIVHKNDSPAHTEKNECASLIFTDVAIMDIDQSELDIIATQLESAVA